MVELIINNIPIELDKKTSIKYTKQIEDIFDIASVSCSFTNSFEFQKTPFNSHAMQNLGISGDGSYIPYQKNKAVLKVDGFDLISKGWFDILETEDSYKARIIDGMIDFFKAIENKTLGKDLNLEDFNHEKTMQSVIDSFNNQYYNYIIADYGGKNIYNNKVNIDYLTPCFSVRELWDLIFKTFGFVCNYSELNYLNGLYITYPKSISETTTKDLMATFIKYPYENTNRTASGGYTRPTPNYFWDQVSVSGAIITTNGWGFVINENGAYFFDLTIDMYVTYRRKKKFSRKVDIAVHVYVNGIVTAIIGSPFTSNSDAGGEKNVSFNLACKEGDFIFIDIFAPSRLDFNNLYHYAERWFHKSTVFKIYKTNLGAANLENELKDLSIKDFIKEILWRTGLTPVLNQTTNTVDFITLDSRLDFNNSQDFSHCFIKRTGEAYQSDYAQKNAFKLKKNIETDLTGDGYIYVPNVNLNAEKTLAQSKIYAPDNTVNTPFFGFSTNQYKIWDSEIKDNNGVAEITYKGLSGRFYFLRKNIEQAQLNLISEQLVDNGTVYEFPIAINNDTLFDEAIYKNYTMYQKIFTNFRIHKIDLAMNINDFISADLTKPFYFRQENAYYICNKISFEEGEKSSGEFIKINKL
jgi:hypothetical protein